MIESGFSHIDASFSKQTNRLYIVECAELGFVFTNVRPSIHAILHIHISLVVCIQKWVFVYVYIDKTNQLSILPAMEYDL